MFLVGRPHVKKKFWRGGTFKILIHYNYLVIQLISTKFYLYEFFFTISNVSFKVLFSGLDLRGLGRDLTKV